MEKTIIKDGKTYTQGQWVEPPDYGLVQSLEERKSKVPVFPSVLCGKCLGSEFQIGYGNWECVAKCKCGNEIIIYTG